MFAKDYRDQARQALRGRWKKMAWLTFLATLLGAGTVGSNSPVHFSMNSNTVYSVEISREMMAAMIVISVIVMLISLWSFFMGSFVRVGYTGMLKDMIDGETPRAGRLFPRGKGMFWKSVGLNFMRSLFIGLWSMLFIFPGVIAAYRYAMADYLLAANPEMGVMDALRESKVRMVGRKWRLFCLELSFIGWSLLAALPGWLVAMVGGIAVVKGIVPGTELDLAAVMPFLGAFAVGDVMIAIAAMFVNTYKNTAQVAFFMDADRAATWREEAREGAQYADEAYASAGETRDVPVNSTYWQAEAAEPMLSADETVARDVFLQHKCSRSLLEKAGLLQEYLQLNPSPISEARWRKDYGDELMRRFDQDPSALDDLIALAGEYGMDDLANRALQRIERHLRQETLNDAEILNMCGRVLSLLAGETFADLPGFVARKKEQIADMADRLEARLNKGDPDGAWREQMDLIRRMCA